MRIKRDDVQPDPCPQLIVERGPREDGVGYWVPSDKHRFLHDYLHVTRHAWKKWPNRIFIDPFAGPGRIQVKGETHTRDGGAVIAWRTLSTASPFTKMLVGDIEPDRANACEQRLKALNAPAISFIGPAIDTVKSMVSAVPRNSLSIAYIDPYNLELLSFSLLEQLSKLAKVDLIINFCTMDLQRNAELEFDPNRARFDAVAPGWRSDKGVLSASKQNVKLAFFAYWCNLVRGLGFSLGEEAPWVENDKGHRIYRMVFFAKSGSKLPTRIWSDVTQGPNRSFDFDD